MFFFCFFVFAVLLLPFIPYIKPEVLSAGSLTLQATFCIASTEFSCYFLEVYIFFVSFFICALIQVMTVVQVALRPGGEDFFSEQADLNPNLALKCLVFERV